MFEMVEEMLGESPVPTHKQMYERLEESGEWAHLPTPRAIGDWIRKGWVAAAPSDTPWSMADAKPEDIPLVLDFVRRTSNKRRRPVPISVATAAWIIRIRRAYPGIADPRVLSRLVSRARLGPEGVREVQTVLTFEPWTATGRRELLEAVARGFVPVSVVWLAGLDGYAGLAPDELMRTLEDEAFEATSAAFKKEREKRHEQ
jgi:hypothetical protein